MPEPLKAISLHLLLLRFSLLALLLNGHPWSSFTRSKVLELALLANVFILTKNGIYPKHIMDHFHLIINRLEYKCSYDSCLQSGFSIGIKKAIGKASKKCTFKVTLEVPMQLLFQENCKNKSLPTILIQYS
jgi:hypothetical protein